MLHACTPRAPPQLEVLADEELRLVDANEVSNDDYASVFDGVPGGGGGECGRVLSHGGLAACAESAG